jgi:hypothetical protein
MVGRLARSTRTVTQRVVTAVRGTLAWPVQIALRGDRRGTRWEWATPVRPERAGTRVEEWMRVRLDVTLGSPGLGGRFFLTFTGGAVILIAFASVVLGIGGGPALLRPLGDRHPLVTAARVAPPPAPPAPTVVPGVPIAATRSFLLVSYTPGTGYTSTVTPASDAVTVGRHYLHLPRRGDDHLLTGELVFPLLPVPARCLVQVQLRVTLLASAGTIGNEAPDPLAAYPSALTSLADGLLPTPVPRLDLVANRPRGDIDWDPYNLGTAGAQGGVPGQVEPPDGQELSADITDLYLGWVAGMRSDTGQPAIAPGTPLVLALRPAFTSVLGDWHHVYAGADSRTPPALVWTRRVHCS